jgi:polyferredoxin/heme/copper-type cytochrome/quinol oxidase subunit 2
MLKKSIKNIAIVFCFGSLFALAGQFFIKEPRDRDIHIRNFRYGKDPSVIRCNRGDRLHLTFSTDDTGHSFFIEEFDMDVKVSPAQDLVSVFKVSDPSKEPVLTKDVTLTAKHPGILNYLVSKSYFRCHVWCGPMHAFEQGKLVIFPNTLLLFSFGSLAGVILIWILNVFRKDRNSNNSIHDKPLKNLLKEAVFFRKVIVSRLPQIVITLFVMALIYIVILTTIFGTKVSGRNLGVLMMWTIWLFVLIAILTPFGGRLWCTFCPLPFFGDWIQRRSFFSPVPGITKEYNNKFFGLFLKWPEYLKNSWLRLIFFLILATFSTTLVAIPKISGITILILFLIPTLMALIWELRSFCRYVCPVNVFVGPFSGLSFLAIRNKSQDICNKCKSHSCQKGSINGWACPYGLNLKDLKANKDCGFCLECIRSCQYNNVSIFKRSFGTERTTSDISGAMLSIAIFTIAIIYSILYLGIWPVVRDYVNIIDKKNWDLFGLYSLILLTLVLIIVPGILYLLAIAGLKLSKIKTESDAVFKAYSGSILPLGMMLWIAFVIPMLFVNVTFIVQSASDPFGWGWDFFGTANIPWHQVLPQFIPWIQAVFILTGSYISLKNLRIVWEQNNHKSRKVFLICLPMVVFIISVSVAMLVFFTN